MTVKQPTYYTANSAHGKCDVRQDPWTQLVISFTLIIEDRLLLLRAR